MAFEWEWVKILLNESIPTWSSSYHSLPLPGGRDAEQRLGLKPGRMAVGSRAMQEGGAFGPWRQEQVELFCVDHLFVKCCGGAEINCNEESLVIDFVFPTTRVGNVGFGRDDNQLGIRLPEQNLSCRL
jgi:hypothetical protein